MPAARPAFIHFPPGFLGHRGRRPKERREEATANERLHLRRLSKHLWSDHEQFEWGTERFDSLQLNAMSGRPAGQYYLALAQEGIPIDKHRAAASGEDESPLRCVWQDEHSKAVRDCNRVTQRSYR